MLVNRPAYSNNTFTSRFLCLNTWTFTLFPPGVAGTNHMPPTSDPSDGFFYPVHPEKTCPCPWAPPQVCPSFPLCLNHTSLLSSSIWMLAAIKHHIKGTGGDLFCACMTNINDYAMNGMEPKLKFANDSFVLNCLVKIFFFSFSLPVVVLQYFFFVVFEEGSSPTPSWQISGFEWRMK